MKGAAAPPPESNNRVRNQSRSSSRRSATRTSSISPRQQNRLESLGFEEGELEMFFETTDFTENQLVERYLEIAQNQPYNLNWGSERVAINADYMLGVYKRNGVEYTKHDIAQDVLSSFYDEQNIVAEGIRKKKRGTRKSRRKHRSHKRKSSHHNRTRHRRRHN